MTRVLIADDDPDIRKLIQTNLVAAGYDVVAAKDGQEAFELFAKHAPDVVLLDVMMPVLDGFACCDKIRELPNGAEVPVAFLTAHGDARNEAIGHGPNDFLTKPISRAELLARVANLVRMKRMADMLRENEDQEKLLRELRTHLGSPVSEILSSARALAADVQDPRLDGIVRTAEKLSTLVDHLETRASSKKA